MDYLSESSVVKKALTSRKGKQGNKDVTTQERYSVAYLENGRSGH